MTSEAAGITWEPWSVSSVYYRLQDWIFSISRETCQADEAL